jgi:hypothetical protein
MPTKPGTAQDGPAIGLVLLRASRLERQRVAGQFAVRPPAGEAVPDQGIEPVRDLQQGGQPVEQNVAPPHMRQFMEQDETLFWRGKPAGEAGGQQELGPPKAVQGWRGQGRTFRQGQFPAHSQRGAAFPQQGQEAGVRDRREFGEAPAKSADAQQHVTREKQNPRQPAGAQY